MLQKASRKLFFLLFLVPTLALALPSLVTVFSQGTAQNFCNAGLGSLCLNQVKRQSQDEAYREAIRICEFRHHGRPRAYTITTSSICSPASLPPQHDGTWVRCRSSARMQCEVEN